MKCPQCGAQVDGDFCPYCGAASQTETPKTEETLKANAPQRPQNTAKSKKPIYKKWWFWVIAAIVIFGMIGKLGSKNKSSVDISEFEWGNLALAEMLPEPESNLGSNLINTEDYLSIDVHEMSKDAYKKYVNGCREKGFKVELIEYDGYYSASNEAGFELMLYYFDDEKKMSIDLTAPLENNNTDNVVEEAEPSEEKTEIVDESERTYEVARKFIELYNEKLDPDILNTKETIREDRILKYDEAYSIQGDIEGKFINVINFGSYDVKDELRIDTYADTPEEVLAVLCNVSTAIGKPLTEDEISTTKQYLSETFADSGKGYTEWTGINSITYFSRYLHQGKTYEIQIGFPIDKFYK